MKFSYKTHVQGSNRNHTYKNGTAPYNVSGLPWCRANIINEGCLKPQWKYRIKCRKSPNPKPATKEVMKIQGAIPCSKDGRPADSKLAPNRPKRGIECITWNYLYRQINSGNIPVECKAVSEHFEPAGILRRDTGATVTTILSDEVPLHGQSQHAAIWVPMLLTI